MKQKIIFKISKTVSMTISGFEKSVTNLSMFDILQISILEKGKHKLIIYENDNAVYGINELNRHLKYCLSNKLEIHPSINNDIGYYWNEYLYKKSNNLKVEVKEWKVTNYLVWQIYSTSTWLYNDDNKIIFKVTPAYKWHFQDPDKNEKFISYKEFIKNYEPLATFELSKKIAQQWLNKTQQLISIMEKNYEKEV